MSYSGRRKNAKTDWHFFSSGSVNSRSRADACSPGLSYEYLLQRFHDSRTMNLKGHGRAAFNRWTLIPLCGIISLSLSLSLSLFLSLCLSVEEKDRRVFGNLRIEFAILVHVSQSNGQTFNETKDSHGYLGKKLPPLFCWRMQVYIRLKRQKPDKVIVRVSIENFSSQSFI